MAPLYFLPSLTSPQISSVMVSHSLLRRANGTSPNPILDLNNTDQSSLQNITISIIGIFIALGSFALAYLQYRRSIQSPSHAPGLDETENTIPFDSKLPSPCLPKHFSLYSDEFPVHTLPSLPPPSHTTSDEFAATRDPPIPPPARDLTPQSPTGPQQEQNTTTDLSTTSVNIVESESASAPRAPRPGNNYQSPPLIDGIS